MANIINGSVTIVVTELGEVLPLTESEFKQSISNNDHNTWVATIDKFTDDDIKSSPF